MEEDPEGPEASRKPLVNSLKTFSRKYRGWLSLLPLRDSFFLFSTICFSLVPPPFSSRFCCLDLFRSSQRFSISSFLPLFTPFLRVSKVLSFAVDFDFGANYLAASRFFYYLQLISPL